MYILAATSFGHAFPDPAPAGGFSAPTLFGALAKAKVSWRYYYLDNSVFLSQFADYANNPAVQSNVRPISEYYSILSGNCGGTACDPDKALPQVIFIERASNSGLDEHPDTGNNNQKGAAVVQQIITALMASPAWKDSAFIFTFDEAGGLYDHVAPFQVPLPDQYAPGQCPDAGSPCTFSSSDAPATFNLSGIRLPMIVISPYAKPHFVSHVNRDSTAILAFIEKMFNVPALTNRDAYFQDPSRDMSEFFDLTTPAMLNAPDGQPWVNSDGTLHVLTPQNTNLKCDSRLEAAPPSAVH
jgi:phospholipase C